MTEQNLEQSIFLNAIGLAGPRTAPHTSTRHAATTRSAG